MDEPQTTPPSPQPPAAAPRVGWPTWRLIAILALVTAGLRAYQVRTTEVTARDGITYIHIAWRLEHGDWREVLRTTNQHPGYPVAVLAASFPCRLLDPGDLAAAMQLAAQLANAAASVLLTGPLFWFAAQLFNRRIAFWSVLLFQCLPSSGRILADGLSEGVFLLFAVTALALAMDAIRSGSVVRIGLAGAAGGLAYLTRPEGLLIPAAAAATLLGIQAVARWRRPWLTVVSQLAVLSCAALLVGAPYMAVIGGLTNKTAARDVSKGLGVEVERFMPADAAPGETVAAGAPLFGVWLKSATGEDHGNRLWAIWTLAEVLSKAFFFFLWVPAVAGLVLYRRRFRESPGAWLPVVLCMPLLGLLFLVAYREGYLSDRHTMLIVACGVPWAAAALDGAALWLARVVSRTRPAAGPVCAACVVAAALAVMLPRTLEPLHGDRAGFRVAGRWVANQVADDENIFDPFGWAAYYSGRYFRHHDATLTSCTYVVVEEGSGHQSHMPTVNEAFEAIRERGGREQCRFPATVGKQKSEVVIYKLSEPWVTRPLPN